MGNVAISNASQIQSLGDNFFFPQPHDLEVKSFSKMNYTIES